MHGYARRNSVEGLAREMACRPAGQIGNRAHPGPRMSAKDRRTRTRSLVLCSRDVVEHVGEVGRLSIARATCGHRLWGSLLAPGDVAVGSDEHGSARGYAVQVGPGRLMDDVAGHWHLGVRSYVLDHVGPGLAFGSGQEGEALVEKVDDGALRVFCGEPKMGGPTAGGCVRLVVAGYVGGRVVVFCDSGRPVLVAHVQLSQAASGERHAARVPHCDPGQTSL